MTKVTGTILAPGEFCNARKLPFSSHIASWTYLVYITILQASQGNALSSRGLRLFAQSPTLSTLIRLGVDILSPLLDSFDPLDSIPK